MPALNYSAAKDKTTEILPSYPDQQGEQSVLTPFSGELSVDEKLKLSNANFKQTIYDFFKDKNIKPLSQLTATPAFPTPHVMAQFAFKTYTEYKTRETDAQYEERLGLPDGWKLLTTASNTSNVNGYFGAAYWNPQNQQVVIAHRGTDPKNLGALWTDLKGVVRNKYVQQMESASTFEHKVAEVLQEFNQEKGPIFQVCFTGHSLGGWLAQITTFTMKYLQIEGKTFLKSDTVPQSYHSHTVVFDSPGCKDMLSQMTDKLDVRLGGRSIDIDHLDITSYLSAPNRINTCNEHLGTVYRIFTDLSDMGWWEKNTALYNLATHSMQKIVEAFDPDTGQVHKDEQGKLKVQVVIDWPVSSGLRGGKEYQSFFKGAKHLNDYHQEVKDVTFQIQGYHPIRYQTKTYDEGVSRLSVFCQQERQFLESYRWLRQLPEFFKPKELFTVMEDNEVQKQVEEIFERFEIENNKIRCADGSILQAFIPYVKRLLQLFPQIKENTTLALSSNGVRNRVYQIETRRYIKRISQSPLDFKADVLSLSDFVRSDQQQVLQLQMVGGDEWTGIIKVYQVLQKTGCLNEGQYTVLKLKRLLSVNKLMDFGTVMLSTRTPHLLLMACDKNQLLNAEAQDVIRTIFNIIKEKPYIKIILYTRSEGTTRPSLQEICSEIFREGFVTRDENVTWSDLTTNLQEKLLGKSVTFQDAKISLNELLSVESPIVNYLPLGVLLEEKEIKISDPVPISSGYNEGYYIGRTFKHQITIKQDIFNDKDVRDSHVYVARSEQEFKQLCEHNPKGNVHWLEKDESGDLVWQQSQGNLKTLREYIDTESSHTYAADDLEELLEEAQHQSVMLISDTAGMGKSTLLTHLSKKIKQNFPAKWVVRIDLNGHTDELKTLEREHIDKEKAIEFISKKVLKHKPGLEMELFKQCCEQKQKVRVVIMLDGFDEICPFYKDTVIDLLQALRQTAIEQLWVTTRPHLRDELEDKLQQLSYTLQPFSEKNQIEFLKKFWSLKDWVTEMDNNEKEENNKKLEIYAEELIKKLVQTISDKEREFAGIPLQSRMLAEAFEKELKIFCQSPESMPQLPFRLDLLGLYGKFIESKYDIYQEEKFQVQKTNVIATEQRERDLKIMREDHHLLALKVLFKEETVALFEDKRECIFSSQQLSRIGIVQVRHDGKPHFIHRTFAEYYVADCLVNRLTEGNSTSEQIQNFILKDIFLDEDCRVIRSFIDGLMLSSSLSNEVLKQYGNGIHDLGEDGALTLHRAAKEDNANIIRFFLESVQTAEHTDTVNMLLLAEDDKRQTAWHMAAYGGNIKALVKLWEHAKDKLTPEELNIKLLLAKGIEGENACHVAVTKGNLQVLQQLWEWAKEILTTEEIKYKFLLGKNNKGETAFHMTAIGGKTELLETLWELAKEELTIEELKKELLLAKDHKERTVWHNTALEGNTLIVKKLWEWAEEKLTTEEIRNKILLAKDESKRTIWHCASLRYDIQLLEKLWVWAKKNLTAEELKIKLLLAKDIWGNTAWYLAVEDRKLEVSVKHWEWAEEILTPGELKNELLLATVGDYSTHPPKYTPLQMAAWMNNTEGFLQLWEWTKEKLTTEELKNKVLLVKDERQKTVWDMAVKKGNIHIVEKIWEWAKEKLNPEELKNKLLLAKGDQEQTVFHVAARHGYPKLVQKLWEWAKENLNSEELKYKFFLAKDNIEEIAFQAKAMWGQTKSLQSLWEWAKQELTTDELKNEVLLAKGHKEQTVWHNAALNGSTLILEELWEWTEEKLTTDEINNKLLLAKDKSNQTIWHGASRRGNIQLLEKIWEWAKRKLTLEKINKKLLLAKDIWGKTAWHVAAEEDQLDVLQKQWEWAKELLTPQELKNELLLATVKLGDNDFCASKYSRKYIALQKAAQQGKTEVFRKLWEWTKEELTTEELKNEVLLVKDDRKQTVWHMALNIGNSELIQTLWEWAEENLTPEDINNTILLDKDTKGKPAWHVVAEKRKPKVVQKLWEWAKERLNPEDIKNKLLLAQDDTKQTVWHYASLEGNIELLQDIWYWAKEKETIKDLNKKLLLHRNNFKQTAWHVATEADNLQVLQKQWEWAKEVLTPQELKNKYLLATAEFGNIKILRGIYTREHTALYVAADQSQRGIFRQLWQWTKEELTTEEIRNEVLLAKGEEEQTIWQMAAKTGNIHVLEKLWEWAKENITPEELIQKLLLDRDMNGNTAWHFAAEDTTTEALQKLWEWAKEELKPADLKIKFLLARNNIKRTAFHVAAFRDKRQVLQALWECAKEKLTTDELENEVLLAKDDVQQTAWHVAAREGNTLFLQKLCDLAEEKLTPEEIINKMSLAQDEDKRNIWHCATLKGNIHFLEKLWEWANEKLEVKDLHKKIVLAKDTGGSTAWHVAAESGKLEVLEKQWEWAKEVLTPQELKNELLLAIAVPNMYTLAGYYSIKFTALQWAAHQGETEVFLKIWKWTEEELTTEEVKNEVLLAKDDIKQTVWHMAAQDVNPVLLEKLWNWAKENLTQEELNSKLLLAKDHVAQTAFHIAAESGTKQVLQKIWEWSKEKMKAEEIKNKFLLANICVDKTVFHVAAGGGETYWYKVTEKDHTEVLEILWEWAKEELTPEELINKWLLGKDDRKRTAWHLAAEKGNIDSLRKLWKWAKQELTAEEFKSKWVLGKDDRKRTAWHLAAEMDNIDSLRKLWKWAKQELTAEEFKSEWVLGKDDRERTAFDMAADEGNIEVLENLQEWALQEFRPEELDNVCADPQTYLPSGLGRGNTVGQKSGTLETVELG